MRFVLVVLAMCSVMPASSIPDSLRPSLTFHASFDKSLDADFARGDGKIYSAPDYKQQSSAKAGLGDVDAVIEKGVGVGGGNALRFRAKNERALFFHADRHAALAGGTLSFWLRLDPQKDLAQTTEEFIAALDAPAKKPLLPPPLPPRGDVRKPPRRAMPPPLPLRA